MKKPIPVSVQKHPFNFWLFLFQDAAFLFPIVIKVVGWLLPFSDFEGKRGIMTKNPFPLTLYSPQGNQDGMRSSLTHLCLKDKEKYNLSNPSSKDKLVHLSAQLALRKDKLFRLPMAVFNLQFICILPVCIPPKKTWTRMRSSLTHLSPKDELVHLPSQPNLQGGLTLSKG